MTLDNLYRNTAVLLLIFSWFLAAGESRLSVEFEHLGVDQGLSHNSGLCIQQDTHGFIWIGTQNGLNRYDGYTFKKYFHEPNDSTSLSDSYINSLFLDSRGDIWVGTNKGGLNRYDRNNDRFQRFQNYPDEPNSIGEGSVTQIAEDANGTIWVAVISSGLFRFNRKNGDFYRIPNISETPGGLRGQRVNALFVDRNRRLWVGTDEGLSVLVEDSLAINFRHFSHNPKNSNSLISNQISAICEERRNDDSKVLWVGTWSGLSRIHISADDEISYTNFQHDLTDPSSISENRIWSIFQDRTGNQWIGTFSKGLNLFDPETGTFSRFQNDNTNPAGFSGNTVRSIFEDNSGIVWFGSEGNGLNLLLPREKQFKYFQHDPANPASISNSDVIAIWEDPNGDMWFGTKHGGANLLKYDDRSRGKFQRFRHDPADPNSLLHNRIRAIYRDKQHHLWLSSWDFLGGLNRFDETTGGFRHFQNDATNPASIADNQVKAIAEDSLGNLWLGLSEAGLDRFDRETGTAVHFPHDPANPNSIGDNAIIDIFTDRAGILWISTFSGGLNRFDPQTNQITRFLPEPGNPYSINHNRVWLAREDRRGRLWVGTAGGLNLFDREHNRFYHFTENDGLCNNSVYGILEDDDGNLWLSTQNGLAKCKFFPQYAALPERIEFFNYNVNDGLPDNEFNTGAALRSRTGELWFGTVKGALHFFPDSIRMNARAPKVVFTDFKIFEKAVELDSAISEKKQITLNYRDNFFSFEFAALDFREPQKNQYSYKLEGFADEWVYSGTRRYVTFNQLEPGDYVFRVRASNSDNIWNENDTSIAIRIRPPFWMTLWFRLLIVMALLIAIVAVVRQIATRPLRKKLREMEVQQQLQSERERISGELHDHIGANLTDLATGLEITKRYLKIGKLPNTGENLDFLEKHTRNTIDELRETIWSLNQNASTVSELCEKLREYIHGRTKLDTPPVIQLQENLAKTRMLTPEQSLNIFRICQEAIHNAQKHAAAQKIQISFEIAQDGALKIEVCDDGAGFENQQFSANGSGFGLINMKRRAEKIGATLDIQSLINNGTRIAIRLPE